MGWKMGATPIRLKSVDGSNFSFPPIRVEIQFNTIIQISIFFFFCCVCVCCRKL